MHKLFFYYILLFVIYSCSLNNSENTSVIKVDYKENLRLYITDNYKKIASNLETKDIELSHIEWINTFYKKVKYSPIWIDDSLDLNKNGAALIELLSTSYDYGLDASFYYSNTLSNISKNLNQIKSKNKKYAIASDLELLLTNSYFKIGQHLNYGIVSEDSSKLVSKIPRKDFNLNLPEYLIKANQADSTTEYLLNLQPQHEEYIKLQNKFKEYLKTTSLSNEKIEVTPFRKDSIKAFQESRKALILHHYLEESSTDSNYISALKKFQVQHGLSPDGLVGKNTAKALSQSPYSNYKKAMISLEKWRWRNQWKDDYIFVNIPSYKVKVYQNNEMVKSFNIVVGKQKNPTPELNDEVEYMIVYPFWNLPYSISSKELLPKIKKDSTYLKRNGYQVFSNNYKSLNDQNINWNNITESNFNYKIRQKSGRKNALGIIKFIFPNKNSIYMHDTPSKRLFKSETRAFSHGCIRVQNPLELADIILESDKNEYNIDSVNNYINEKKQKKIILNTKIPVHIQYFTCGTDSNNIVFYRDIYGLDKKLEELMGLKNQFITAKTSGITSK